MNNANDLQLRLESGRQRLLRSIEGVNEEQFKRRPGAPADLSPDGGDWCIAEVLAHLLALERLQARRIAQAAGEDGGNAEPAEPEALVAQTRAGRHAPVPQLIHGLLAVRREIEEAIKCAEGSEGGLQRAITHPQRGLRSIAMIVVEDVIEHEAEHVAQIEALRITVGAPPVETQA